MGSGTLLGLIFDVLIYEPVTKIFAEASAAMPWPKHAPEPAKLPYVMRLPVGVYPRRNCAFVVDEKNEFPEDCIVELRANWLIVTDEALL